MVLYMQQLKNIIEITTFTEHTVHDVLRQYINMSAVFKKLQSAMDTILRAMCSFHRCRTDQ